MDEDDEDDEEELNIEGRRRVPKNETSFSSTKSKERLIFEGEDEEEEDNSAKWKANLFSKVSQNFKKNVNLMDIIYGNYTTTNAASSKNKQEDEDFFTLKKESSTSIDIVDSSKYTPTNIINLVDDDDESDLLLERFVAQDDILSSLGKEEGEDGALYGDFEDLETKEVFKSSEEDKEAKQEEKNQVDDKNRKSKKEKLKEAFNKEYDAEEDEENSEDYFSELKADFDKQTQLIKTEFQLEEEGLRTEYEGFRIGSYVRIEIDNIPSEFIMHLNATVPIVIGALNTSEESLGLMQVKFKKHRWHKKILKSNDPLIFSIGWRRFQSIPIYSIQDRNDRNRMLKYTPEHMHCVATLYGPLTPPNTGVIAFQYLSNSVVCYPI